METSLDPQLTFWRLSVFEALPSCMRFSDDFQSMGLVECTLIIAKRIQRLSIRGLVPAEPLTDAADGAREYFINVCYVIHLCNQGVVFIDSDQLPIKLPVIDHGQETKDFDL